MNFLVVSTIEVRKCHELVLNAFELLWDEGYEIELTFVGREGWKVDNFISRMKSHKNLNKNFFWFNNLSDEGLEAMYKNSVALINASIGEGFGLPIVEASHFGLPLILRDIRIFREIAGMSATYFKSDEPRDLANTIKTWIDDFWDGKILTNNEIQVFSWQDTCEQIIDIIKKDI
jgi:glycosyltransferase involved in cell wall biosynthesis